MSVDLIFLLYPLLGALTFFLVKKLLPQQSQLWLFTGFFYSLIIWPLLLLALPGLYLQYRQNELIKQHIYSALNKEIK